MELINYIKKIPISRLVEIIGADVIDGLQKYEIANTQHDISEILLDLKGNEIFRTPGLLKSLLWNFSSVDLERLYYIMYENYSQDCEVFRRGLLTTNWGNNKSSRAILKFFDIADESYLNVIKEESVDNEIVIPRLSTDAEVFEDYNVFIPEMYPLHSYQKTTKDKIVDLLIGDEKRFILHMPTGAGKTKTTVEGMVDFWRVKGKRQGFMVWFAHSKELCEQSYEAFKNTWAAKGDYPIQMFRIFDDNTPDLSNVENGILFVGFQKFYGLINGNHPTALRIKNTTRLIVVDEAHKTIAPTYEKAIKYLLSPDTRIVGLTATPGRSADINDPENAQLSAFFHNNKVTISDEYGGNLSQSIKYLQQNKYLARLRRIKVDSGVTIENDKRTHATTTSGNLTFSNEALAKLSSDDVRNSRILTEIEKAVIDRGHPTLVFSTNTSHAIIMKILLSKKHIKAECVLANTPANLRAQYISSFKSGDLPVLINYGVLTTGFDAPNIRTLVISRPTMSIVLYSQMLGRALRGPRMGGAAEENVLVDIIDNYCEFGTERAAFNYFDEYYSEN